MGLGAMGFAQAYARSRPHMLVVLGDRFEMHAAALAALPFKIPVAHIHGGELTYGAMDDALRHCITKLSHLHFVATDEYKRRVIQLGEEPWRVTLCGALSLDNLRSMALMDLNEIKAEFGADLSKPTLLVTFHPVTLEFERTEWQAAELLAALHECGMQILFTQPNADTSGRLLAAMIERFVAEHSSAHFVNNLGTRAYFSVMTLAAAMVGNSSSGIIEAPSFGLPVVNIGTRQKGRTRAANVIDVGYRRSEIAEGIRRACDARFRASLSHLSNPYSHGEASEIIVSKIKEVALDEALILKRFYEDSFKIEN
jgi:UDP-N-acetylglucosamine 2-epimerase (non-hydrolysing)/GDP/UDP-N,N'-diacetylbacillosamine 2-epimerase (hydrolysing)